MESNWLREDTTADEEDIDTIQWLENAFKPTAEELKDVRDYMESYFADEQHRDRQQSL